MNRPSGIGLVRVVMLLGVGLLTVLFFASPPHSTPRLTHAAPAETREVVEVTTTAGPGHGFMVTPLERVDEVAAVPEGEESDGDADFVRWTSRSVEVHMGPDKGYVVIGQLPRSARLRIVGRDESSKWVGIVFSPYTGLTGWIEASAVAGQLNVSGLDIAPVTLLKLSR
jgi:hypothetical protein